ncbi:hypothetical protein SYNPS1DRAFT_27263 [Syncephalis pseudoplumigaleata]|uniref:Thioredoxin domain-containing protein n=1 Tax=Syncephalis pseudoplumigaleata TaxID=1712513 RepID=A0A4P9Z3N3_9FUNG|nr:hypothetical protein SYNPS1DRAFT_27263 [Syncephalis pseudoplumigaleata]|eukprot:RKP27076.1 hypothetical protein SYNPS1DRAFT_27263 [Syncephalis pseudoplumigaleata]
MCVDYQGAREADAIVEAALDRLPSWSTTLLTADASTIARANIDLFLRDEDAFRGSLPAGLPKAILLTDKAKVAPLIRALALDFYGRIRMGVSRDAKLLKRYNVKKTPTLLIAPESGDEPIIYEGGVFASDAAYKMVYSKMHAFLEAHAAPLSSSKSTKQAKKQKKEKKQEKKSDAEVHQDIIEVQAQADIDRCFDGRDHACFLVLLDNIDESNEEQVKADREHLAILNRAFKEDREAEGVFEFAYLRAPNDGLIAKQLELPAKRPLAVALEWPSRLFMTQGEDEAFTLDNVQRMIALLISKRGENLQPLAFWPTFGPASASSASTTNKEEEQDGGDGHDEL